MAAATLLFFGTGAGALFESNDVVDADDCPDGTDVFVPVAFTSSDLAAAALSTFDDEVDVDAFTEPEEAAAAAPFFDCALGPDPLQRLDNTL